MCGSVKVVNKYKSKFNVYIGRGSVFGNPFRMYSEKDRDLVCDKYIAYIKEEAKKENSPVVQGIKELRARYDAGEELILGCFCAPKRCHGDYIKSLIENRK